jgi:hypothetical protein
MRRREFIIALGGAVAVWPRVARGQVKPATIGVLGSGSAQSSAFLIDALKEGMKENGLTETRLCARCALGRRRLQTVHSMMPANDAEVSFFAYPTSGKAPLLVQFTIIGAKGNYRLDFGDGRVVGPAICMEGPSCLPDYTIDHTYTLPGSFIAALSKSADGSQVGSVTVRVTER